MGTSNIPYCTRVWEVTRGCTPVSSGCRNCWAARYANRFQRHLVTKGAFNGTVELLPEKLGEPLHWRKPQVVFVNSRSDLFHYDVPIEYIIAVMAVMAACPRHLFLLLTKRNPWPFFSDLGRGHTGTLFDAARNYGVDVGPLNGIHWPLPNLHLGVSCEDQDAANERIPWLLKCPATNWILSLEPLLSRIGLVYHFPHASGVRNDKLTVIVGGESGPRARPCNVDWVLSIVEQCREARVKCYVKQLGSYPILDPRYDRNLGAQRKLRDRAGADPEEWPADLRVQQLPWRMP